MRSLGKAIIKRFKAEADLSIGPNWRPPHRENELKKVPKKIAAKPKAARAKAREPTGAKAKSDVSAATTGPAEHVNGYLNGNGLVEAEAVA